PQRRTKPPSAPPRLSSSRNAATLAATNTAVTIRQFLIPRVRFATSANAERCLASDNVTCPGGRLPLTFYRQSLRSERSEAFGSDGRYFARCAEGQSAIRA